MSIPDQINQLNELGRQLNACAERVQHCADALVGMSPEVARDTRPPNAPIANNIDSQLFGATQQYEEVLSGLRSNITRIENALALNDKLAGMPTGMGKAAY